MTRYLAPLALFLCLLVHAPSSPVLAAGTPQTSEVARGREPAVVERVMPTALDARLTDRTSNDLDRETRMSISVQTTHGKNFRRCGIEFSPDPVEVTVGPERDPGKRQITADDLLWLKKAAGPYEKPNPNVEARANEPMVKTGAVLRIVENGKAYEPPPKSDAKVGESVSAASSKTEPPPKSDAKVGK